MDIKDMLNSRGEERKRYLNEITKGSLQGQLEEAFLTMPNQLYQADMKVKEGIIFGDINKN